MSKVLEMAAEALARVVEAPSGIRYHLRSFTHLELASKMGGLQAFRGGGKKADGEPAEAGLKELYEVQRATCAVGVSAIEYGGVVEADVPDPGEWPGYDVPFVYVEIQKGRNLVGAEADGARRAL